MGSLDSTIVLLAFPAINDSLHSDLATSIWIILAYLLVLAVATTQMGRIGDIYGQKQNIQFRLRNLHRGFSTMRFLTPHLPADSIQSSSSGGRSHHASNKRSNHRRCISPRERGKAYGYNSLGFTSGAMLGIVLGGIITTFVSWQYIFFINIPIGIIAVIVGLKYLKDTEKTAAKLDLAGMGLLAAALVLAVFGAGEFCRTRNQHIQHHLSSNWSSVDSCFLLV